MGLKILARHLPQGDKMMVADQTVARTSFVAHGPNEVLGDVSYWFTKSVRLIRLLSIPGRSQSAATVTANTTRRSTAR